MTAESLPRRSTQDLSSKLAAAASLIKAGQNRAAADLLKPISISSPTANPRIDYLLGVATFRSGDLRTAEGAFRRCVEVNPRNGPAQYGLSRTLRAQGDHEGARLALDAAERADPRIAVAHQRLLVFHDKAENARPDVASSPRASRAAGQSSGADSAAESMADILDRITSQLPAPDELAGDVIWKGRPALRSIIMPAAGPFLLLVVPLLIRRIAEGLPPGAIREAVVHLSRLATSAAMLLAIIFAATLVVNWFMRELVIRERRLEIWTGLLGHRHVMLWLHDLERQLTIRQPLWHLVLNLGTLEITSTILPTPKSRRAATRTGKIRFSGLSIQEAEKIAEEIWSRSLWERRRMVKNFVSNR
jgi:Tetratricopeptide repeat